MVPNSLRTLVLNADGCPLAIVSWRRGLTLSYSGRTVILDFYDRYKARDGKGRSYPVPAVVVVRKYVRRNYAKAPFSRKHVYFRDGLRCMYCWGLFEPKELTFDHVIPKSKGGLTRWENIVSCCYPCNRKKADRTCAESGMYPLCAPHQPSYSEMFISLGDRIPGEWVSYIHNLPLHRESPVYVEQKTPL